MKTISLVTIVMSTALYVDATNMSSGMNNSTSCPTWFYYNTTSERCECGAEIADWIYCDQITKLVLLQNGFCVTYSGQEGLFYISHCPTSYKYNRTNRMFSELPTDPSLLEDMMCGPYNRKGFLCSECISGYGPGVYVFNRTCAKCSKFSLVSGIAVNILADIVPITLFFLCVVLFRLDITTGPLFAYVVFCQEFSASQQYDPTVYDYIHSNLPPFLAWGLQLMYSLFQCWNLDFLNSFLPPVCMSENLRGIHVLVIDSVSAVYPVLLVILSLVLIHLHGRGNRVVQTLSKPFSCLAKRTNITTDAVVRAFATFIFLSAMKNLFTFYCVVRPINVHKSTDGLVAKSVLYIDPTINTGSTTHILYCLILLLQCVFLVFIPSLILFLYPTKLYQKLARKCLSPRKRLSITIFVESLNNKFRSKLDGGQDYRALSGILISFLPLLSLWVFIFEKITHAALNLNIAFCYLFACLALLGSYTRPFKFTISNLSCSYYFVLFGIGNIVAYLWYEQLSFPTQMLEILFGVIGLAAQAPFFMWVSYKLICYIKIKFCTQSSSILDKIAK